jgi:hypothetical protein
MGYNVFMLKITLTAIKQYAEMAGIEFSAERSGYQWSVDCYAPTGKIWRGSGTHFLALPADGFYGTPDWSESMNALKTEIEYGFEDCDETDCEQCIQDREIDQARNVRTGQA